MRLPLIIMTLVLYQLFLVRLPIFVNVIHTIMYRKIRRLGLVIFEIIHAYFLYFYMHVRPQKNNENDISVISKRKEWNSV